MPRVLVVGALAAETAPLIGFLWWPRPVSARCVAGKLGPAEVAVLTCGVGERNARERTLAALQLWDAAVVVSVGTCGALVDRVRPGDVVSAVALLRDTTHVRPLTPLVGCPGAWVSTVDRAVTTPERRTELAQAGAEVCEMEAAGVAEAAADRSFHVLKVVSDLAGGEPDPVLARGRLAEARFQARAMALSHARLLPALEAAFKRL